MEVTGWTIQTVFSLLLNLLWEYKMLLQFSDLQTKHEQTMTKTTACNSNQPLGLQKESLTLLSQLDFFPVSVVFGNNPQIGDLGCSVSQLILTLLLNSFQCQLGNTCIELQQPLVTPFPLHWCGGVSGSSNILQPQGKTGKGIGCFMCDKCSKHCAKMIEA